jgi:hypothetical protein
MNDIVDIATMLVVVGGIMVLARPGSQGPSLVSAFGNAFSGALATATGSIPSGYQNAFSGGSGPGGSRVVLA